MGNGKVKIYTLSDPRTNEVKYVGKTEKLLSKRLYYHIFDNNKIKNIHKKKWIEGLLKNSLKPDINIVDIVPYDEWKFWEKYWISQFITWGFKLTNKTEGGEGYTYIWLKRLWENDEYRKHHTERMIGKKNPFYGKHHTEETKNILRKKCPHPKGENHPCYGKKQTEEFKEKNRKSQPKLKKIIRLDINGNYIDEWDGIRHMCRKLNNLKLNDAAVIRVAKGKQKHHKGFLFKYK